METDMEKGERDENMLFHVSEYLSAGRVWWNVDFDAMERGVDKGMYEPHLLRRFVSFELIFVNSV